MKKIFVGALALVVLVVVFLVTGSRTGARDSRAALPSPNIVISQFYGGGGNVAGSQFTHDFIELFNRGSQPVSLGGWSTQYASATGTNWLVAPLPNVTLQPGQYFLIRYASGGTSGAPLPTPDFDAPPVTVNGNTFVPNLSGTAGKIALVNSTTQLPASTCPVDASIVDLVGYGSTASCFEAVRAADLTNTTSHKRNGNGCADTDNNANDFAAGTPAPRNTSTPTSSCNLGSQLQAGISANPNIVAPGGNTLLTVTVIPATTPPSTGITVVGNLTDIGGPASQIFFDDGTNGDTTAGDNVFSFRATIPGTFTGGSRVVTAIASDAQSRVVNLTQNITINAPLPNEDPLILGNPSNATPDPANENNYLMPKPQYTLSYNRSKATANWVGWRLDSSWIGSVQRQDDFRPDPALPADWYQVQTSDYSGSGYDRGHMVPSGDRTNTVANNSSTFLMTNIVPQLAANNQGSWEEFESYCRTLAQAGNELYIFSGPVGQIGTIAGGRIVVPQYTWKVVLVLPNGDNDLARIHKGTRTIGIVVPNFPPLDINAPWRNFRVSVDHVELLTGYNFFSSVPKNTQEMIERRRDRQ